MFNKVFRKYFRTVLRRDQYYGKVIQSHNVLPGNLSLYANKQISKLRMTNSNANELTVVESYLQYACPADELAPLNSISFPESTFPLSSGTGNKRLWDKKFSDNRILVIPVELRRRERVFQDGLLVLFSLFEYFSQSY